MRIDYKYILGLIAFLDIALTTGGQNLPSGTYIEDPTVEGIAYAKRATINPDGTYTIDLESFVTGEVTQTFEGVPCDVVLVLDVSGSMDEAISSVSSYEVADVSSIRGSDGPSSSWSWGVSYPWETDYYYYYDGEYRRVSVNSADAGGWSWTTYYFLQFRANGRTYYINTSGQVVNQQPTNVTSDDTNLLASNVQLYEQVTTITTKMDALKTAVGAFIDQINHNDWYEDDTDEKPRKDELGNPAPLNNRISIVKFAMNRYYGWQQGTGAEADNAPTTVGNHDYYYGPQGYTPVPDANYTEVIADFTLTKDADNVAALKQVVNGLHAAGATAADFGMNLARLLINSIGEDRANSGKTVVFFTDGAPTHVSDFDTNVANAALRNSNKIKAVTYGEGEDATHPAVFSVGVFKSGDATTQVTNFMTNIATDSSHYMDASGGSAEDLKDIFTAIAHSAGGSGNTDVSGTSSVTVDIVSSSFSVPKDFEDNPGGAITVLVAPCNGVTNIGGKDYLTFGQAKTPAEYGLDDIVPSISEKDNKVSTTGFDFSKNWCGPDSSSPTGYHGYKQIIRFVITVNEDAVGGPSVDTNDSESGIYLAGSDEPLVKFNKPTVKLPVNIWIQKDGLEGDDSAVITIYRFPFNPDYPSFDPSASGAIDPSTNKPVEWEHFTKIMITKDDKIFIKAEDGTFTKEVTGKKVSGLSPDYYYRLKEDAWAWTYTYQVNGSLYTVGEGAPENPFIFVNVPNPVKGAEARARNVFNEKTLSSGGDEGGEEGGESGSK